MTELFFITGNENKFKEVQAMLPQVKQLNVDLLEIQSIDAHEIMKHKLLEAQKIHQGQFIIEDSSLYIEGMKGLPGPLIKWFEKTIKLEGIAKLTELFGNKAKAVVLLGYAHNEKIEFFEGSIGGTIVFPRGENGFGWDKIFIPQGYDKTFAEMTKEEKNKISMRKVAVEKLKEFLITIFLKNNNL